MSSPAPTSPLAVEEPKAAMQPDSPKEVQDVEMTDATEAEANTNSERPNDASGVNESKADTLDVKLNTTTKAPPIKLEELFDGFDSDDDEFPTSSQPDEQRQSSPDSGPVISTELLRTFYQRFFPWRYMFQWLNHSPTPTNDFKHREFSLWLPNEAVLRYQSYTSADEFRAEVLRVMPARIEIGPVYTANPKDRKLFRNSTVFRPLAKELCFDIDLTDYDDIRTCCDKAKICIKCWQFITMAIKVLDTALRDDFGFKHILWVYSGRRGAHAWVCDKQARILNDEQRKAITGYFEVLTGGQQSGKRVNLRRPLHPHLSRSLDILKDHFQHDVLEKQDPWSDSDKASVLLNQIPDPSLREALRRKWDSSPGRPSALKWADIDALAQSSASSSLDAKDLLDAKQDIVLEHTYPRLDVGVTQKLNHLLKSPFVVHPGTGRICVPIDTRTQAAFEAFDPLAVPTLPQIVREVDAWEKQQATAANGDGEGRRLQDWEKTSLKPYIEYFRWFVLGLMKDERESGIKREREDDDEDRMIKAEDLEF